MRIHPNAMETIMEQVTLKIYNILGNSNLITVNYKFSNQNNKEKTILALKNSKNNRDRQGMILFFLILQDPECDEEYKGEINKENHVLTNKNVINCKDAISELNNDCYENKGETSFTSKVKKFLMDYKRNPFIPFDQGDDKPLTRTDKLEDLTQNLVNPLEFSKKKVIENLKDLETYLKRAEDYINLFDKLVEPEDIDSKIILTCLNIIQLEINLTDENYYLLIRNLDILNHNLQLKYGFSKFIDLFFVNSGGQSSFFMICDTKNGKLFGNRFCMMPKKMNNEIERDKLNEIKILCSLILIRLQEEEKGNTNLAPLKILRIEFYKDKHMSVVMEVGIGDLVCFQKYLDKRMDKDQRQQYNIAMAIRLYDYLKFLSGNQIYHRDIKPQNIIIVEENFLKLIDYGLAKKTSLVNGYHREVGTKGFIKQISERSKMEHIDNVKKGEMNLWHNDLYSLIMTISSWSGCENFEKFIKDFDQKSIENEFQTLRDVGTLELKFENIANFETYSLEDFIDKALNNDDHDLSDFIEYHFDSIKSDSKSKNNI